MTEIQRNNPVDWICIWIAKYTTIDSCFVYGCCHEMPWIVNWLSWQEIGVWKHTQVQIKKSKYSRIIPWGIDSVLSLNIPVFVVYQKRIVSSNHSAKFTLTANSFHNDYFRHRQSFRFNFQNIKKKSLNAFFMFLAFSSISICAIQLLIGTYESCVFVCLFSILSSWNANQIEYENAQIITSPLKYMWLAQWNVYSKGQVYSIDESFTTCKFYSAAFLPLFWFFWSAFSVNAWNYKPLCLSMGNTITQRRKQLYLWLTDNIQIINHHYTQSVHLNSRNSHPGPVSFSAYVCVQRFFFSMISHNSFFFVFFFGFCVLCRSLSSSVYYIS